MPWPPLDHAALCARIQDLSRAILPLPTEMAAHLPVFDGIRAVVFDVYGTLFVSGVGDIGVHMCADNAAAMCEALRACGFGLSNADMAQTAVDEFMAAIAAAHQKGKAAGVEYPEIEVRLIWAETLRSLLQKGILRTGASLSGICDAECITEERLRDFPEDVSVVERLAVEYECRVNPVWPMPDLVPILKSLQTSGACLGIVSNAQFYTPLLFDSLAGHSLGDLGFTPEVCVWSYAERQGKPSVDLYAQLVKRIQSIGLQPNEVLYVGNDMLKDVYAASQVGLKTVLFAGDKRSLRRREEDERCRAMNPDAVITALGQLPPLLSG